MLFFLRSYPKRDTSQRPTVEYLEKVIKEWETVIDYKVKGKVLGVFCFSDGNGAFSIWSVESKEELNQIVTKLPMYPFAEWEIIPLWTAEETLEKAKKALNLAKA